MHRLVRIAGLLLAATLILSPVYAQIDHDTTNHVYFVTGDAAINSDFSGNEIFVGKDNYANFATLPGTITLTVNGGAVTDGFSNRAFPDGKFYSGLSTVGAHRTIINGGTIGTLSGYNDSITTINGGQVALLQNYDNSVSNITGGTIFAPVFGYDNSVINFSGGTIGAYLAHYLNSTVTITGGTVPKVFGYGGTTTISGGLITEYAVAVEILNQPTSLTFTGSGLTVTSLGSGSYFDGGNNLIGTKYTLTGTLTNGDPINISVLAGDTATGDSSQRTFNGGALADNLYLLSDTTVSSVVNLVSVGRDITNTTNASPTVTFDNAANTGQVRVYNNSILNINGATVNGPLFANDNSTVNIAGGTVASADGFDNSTVNVTAGTLNSAGGQNAAALNIGGGTVNNVSIADSATLTMTGGASNFVMTSGTSVANIAGGTVEEVFHSGQSTTNITGGTIQNYTDTSSGITTVSGGTVGRYNGNQGTLYAAGGAVSNMEIRGGAVNVSGGAVGGLDGDTSDFNFIGVYLTGGTLNLYGSGFTRNNITNGTFGGFAGTYSTLVGTLLDGSALNTTFFLADTVTYEDLGGGTQDNPLLPDSNANGIFTFNGVPTRAWFDPPSVDTFLFTMIDGHKFTDILDFPTGFDGPFTVSVNGNALGQFGPGQAVDFAAFGFAEGVTSFTVSGISPLADAANPQAFPIQLAFNAPFASFTMQGIGGNVAAAPEPATIGLLLIGMGASGVFLTNRRRL